MNRARLILVIRFTAIAFACWLLGMPLSIVTLIVPVALLPSVLFDPEPVNCGNCRAPTTTATITISGVVNGPPSVPPCTDCADINGSYVVTNTSSCHFSSSGAPAICGAFIPTGLTYTVSAKRVVSYSGGLTWATAVGNCGHSLPLGSNSTFCDASASACTIT